MGWPVGSATAPIEHLLEHMPRRLRTSLLPFQRRGVEQLLGWGARGLLGDEMGLGKTRQALGCLGALHEVARLQLGLQLAREVYQLRGVRPELILRDE